MKKIILWVLCCAMCYATKAQTDHIDRGKA